VTRFSIFDFSIGFPIFFKLSPKMLYLGPNYPRKVGQIAIYYFVTPLAMFGFRELEYELLGTLEEYTLGKSLRISLENALY
jgi:hypothetical protein